MNLPAVAHMTAAAISTPFQLLWLRGGTTPQHPSSTRSFRLLTMEAAEEHHAHWQSQRPERTTDVGKAEPYFHARLCSPAQSTNVFEKLQDSQAEFINLGKSLGSTGYFCDHSCVHKIKCLLPGAWRHIFCICRVESASNGGCGDICKYGIDIGEVQMQWRGDTTFPTACTAPRRGCTAGPRHRPRWDTGCPTTPNPATCIMLPGRFLLTAAVSGGRRSPCLHVEQNGVYTSVTSRQTRRESVSLCSQEPSGNTKACPPLRECEKHLACLHLACTTAIYTCKFPTF